jgi:hypothetical protein
MGIADTQTLISGQEITEARLNLVFDNVATESATINADNYADEAFGRRHLADGAVCDVRELVENTSLTPGTYTGTTIVPIGHGSSALEYTTAFTLAAGDVLRLDWWQFVHQFTTTGSHTMAHKSTIRAQWDVGAGWVDGGINTGTNSWIPKAVVRPLRPIPVGSPGPTLVAQKRRHLRGSGIYVATGLVPVNGLRLTLKPEEAVVADGVALTQGAMYIHVYRR